MSSLVQAITPPVVGPGATQVFSDAKVEDLTARTAPENKVEKTDFRTLINNSIDEVKKERKAKENGDLTAGSDAEFLQKLADQSKEKRKPGNELGKDDFLKLFVTQLQNQDPMNPDDGTEMAAKLAQFNGLEQMMNVNKGIEKLIAAQGTSRNMEMMNYIGKEVTVDGGRVRLQGGVATATEFTTEVPLAATTLEIRDGNGILVNQVDLGPMDSGTHPLKWDGKTHDGRQLSEGVFTYNLSARNVDGDNIPLPLTSKVKINGVDIKSTDGALYSDFGRVTFDQIRSVGKAGYDSVETPKGIPGAAAIPGSNIKEGAPLPNEIKVPIQSAQTADKPQSKANPEAVSPADALDKLQAQGNLNLKKPGSEAAAAAKATAAKAKLASEAVKNRAGATATEAPDGKKAADPQPVPAANVLETAPSAPVQES